jgi:hypothetical protein
MEVIKTIITEKIIYIYIYIYIIHCFSRKRTIRNYIRKKIIIPAVTSITWNADYYKKKIYT